jgi:hypothetical protein
LRGKKLCYLTVELLELVESASALRGALKVMNSLRGKVCFLIVELLELVDECISLKGH